jgi:hypothetical protein
MEMGGRGSISDLNLDTFVKSQKNLISVIPAQAGIQEFQPVTKPLDTRFRGYDDFLREHEFNIVHPETPDGN